MRRTWSLPSRPAPGQLSEEQCRKIEAVLGRYCEARVPPHVRGEIQLLHRIRGTTATLVERRPAWRAPGEWTELPVAQFRYEPQTELWTLYCRDRNLRWHRYDGPSRKTLSSLLREVDADRTGIFWG